MGIFLAMLFFISIACCGMATAKTYNIGPSKSIQSTINNAQPGDTINLAPGTYKQYNIKINKDITITGPSHSGTPTAIIDAQQKGNAFQVYVPVKATLNNLMIKNAYGYNGGIFNQGKLTVNKCTITKNTAVSTGGGGIYNSGTLTVYSSNLIYNKAINGYGGGIHNGGSLTLKSSKIKYNEASSGGGGIYMRGISSSLITKCYIEYNKAQYGGGIFNNEDIKISYSSINHNTATYSGGGIFNGAKLTLNTCHVDNNSAANGGGICSSKILSIIYSTVKYNKTSQSYGGGIYNTSGTATVHYSQIYGNTNLQIYSYPGKVNAQNNWWGSNANPSSKVSENVYVTPWLSSPP